MPMPPLPRQSSAKQIAQPTLTFWTLLIALHILSQAAGIWIGPGISRVAITAVCMACGLAAHLRADGYSSWRFWLAVAGISAFSTALISLIVRPRGLPPDIVTIFFGACLIFLFGAGTAGRILEAPAAPGAEPGAARYWLTASFACAFGAAAGEWAAADADLGNAGAALLSGGMLALAAIGRCFGVAARGCYWIAFVAVKALAATSTALFMAPEDPDALQWGGVLILLFMMVVIALVVHLSATDTDAGGGRN